MLSVVGQPAQEFDGLDSYAVAGGTNANLISLDSNIIQFKPLFRVD
jgi:predicted acetyltransferase